jgi:putative transposase
MNVTYKYRICPTKAQAAFLAGQLRYACDLYNDAKQERDGAWRDCRKSINYYDQAYQLKAMRAEGLIGLVNFTCCQEVLIRLDRAYKAFFARVKRGEKPGFPRYRSFRRYDSIVFHYDDGCRLLDNGKLHVQGAGHIKIKLHRPLEGEIKLLTIKREAGRWFACFSVDRAAVPLPACAAETGVDVGLSSFAVLSDGTAVENPRYYRKAQDKLRRCQRKVARRPNKHSKRRAKAVELLQRAHAEVRNQRRDFHHKEARKLVNNYGLIAVEDLNVKGMARGLHPKSVHDAGWAQFLGMIVYKAAGAGRRTVQVNPNGTSQTCLCGAAVPKALADRWHDCPACGLSASRDHVSAQVILSRARNAGLESGTGGGYSRSAFRRQRRGT